MSHRNAFDCNQFEISPLPQECQLKNHCVTIRHLTTGYIKKQKQKEKLFFSNQIMLHLKLTSKLSSAL